MIINKIKLENIRSFINQEIIFPKNSVLLSGDIGSGKSTILLAMDFALFGFTKNKAGLSLLRNGEQKGNVELFFNLDGNEVIIKRSLKRTSKGVAQDSGSIIINNEKREATPIELKQAILELFHYPNELLTKSKSLIYKYTVYTPQEEMKQILTVDKEIRIDTLRKVFGIDKYKLIKENSKILTNYFKDESKELEGKISDLIEKELNFNNLEIQEKSISESLIILNNEKEIIINNLESNKKELEKLETEN